MISFIKLEKFCHFFIDSKKNSYLKIIKIEFLFKQLQYNLDI